MDKVSVVVPTKNSANTLESCLRSIREQTYPAIECIVVDNFSTDATPDIARKWADHFFSQGPERSTQRNYGAKQASGKYVVFIDSDMILTPKVIEDCVSRMDEATAGVVIPETSFGPTFWAKCKAIERACYVGDPYIEASRFFRREDFLAAGGYNEDLIGNEDWALHNEIEKRGAIRRIDSFIHHNEGHITLFKSAAKKGYYSTTFDKYRRMYPEKAKYQYSTGYRLGLLLKGWKQFFAHPLAYLGMFLMKVLELLAYKTKSRKSLDEVYKSH